MTKRRMWMYLAAGMAIALPAIAWATFKPVRILAPLEEVPLTVFCSSRECYRSFAPPDYDLPGYARPLALRYAEWEKRTGRNKVWRAAKDLERLAHNQGGMK